SLAAISGAAATRMSYSLPSAEAPGMICSPTRPLKLGAPNAESPSRKSFAALPLAVLDKLTPREARSITSPTNVTLLQRWRWASAIGAFTGASGAAWVPRGVLGLAFALEGVASRLEGSVEHAASATAAVARTARTAMTRGTRLMRKLLLFAQNFVKSSEMNTA